MVQVLNASYQSLKSYSLGKIRYNSFWGKHFIKYLSGVNADITSLCKT